MKRLIVAVLVYPVVALLSFWRFGDYGVTVGAVLVAAAFNVAFGLAFGWRAVWLPAVIFGAWYLAGAGAEGCENCHVIWQAGAFSLLFALVGAAIRQIVTLSTVTSA